MLATPASRHGAEQPLAFHHDALLYSDNDEFLAGTVPFIRAALADSQPVLVAVPDERLQALSGELGGDAEAVEFVNMEGLGANPMRMISAWRDFVEAHPGRKVRGIAEPIWEGRSEEEIVECQRHESLLNLAFADANGFWLRCPYDCNALDDAVLQEVEHSHPHLSADGLDRSSPSYQAPDIAPGPFEGFLSEPPEGVQDRAFKRGDLSEARRFVAFQAVAAGLSEARTHDVVLAVNELAGNSVRHGGGSGTMLAWREPGAVVYEVRDRGFIEEHLAGRLRPGISYGGRGLWLANQVCDLVQVRSRPGGTAVRIHMRIH